MFNSKYEIHDTAALYFEAYEADQHKAPQDRENLKKFHETVDREGRKGTFSMATTSLRDLFEAFVPDGREALDEMRPNRRKGGVKFFQEAGDAVNTSHFSNIFGQMTYSEVLKPYDSPELIGRSLVTTVPAKTQYQEIIPGVSGLSDVGAKVGEGEEYTKVGLSENYIRIPEKIKTGFQIEVTEETIFEDNMGLISEALSGASEIMAINEEKEILDVCLGITSLYDRNGSGAQATYGDTHTPTGETFDNLAASNALVDYSDVEAALLLFDAITDPNTGEPIMLGGPLDVVVPTALLFTAGTIFDAGTRYQDGDTTASGPVRHHANPVTAYAGRSFQLKSNQYVKARTSSATTWFVGNFRKAFRYYEIYPVEVQIMPQTQDVRYNRDIVTGLRVRRKGRAAVYDPRYVVKCTQ